MREKFMRRERKKKGKAGGKRKKINQKNEVRRKRMEENMRGDERKRWREIIRRMRGKQVCEERRGREGERSQVRKGLRADEKQEE